MNPAQVGPFNGEQIPGPVDFKGSGIQVQPKGQDGRLRKSQGRAAASAKTGKRRREVMWLVGFILGLA